MRIRRIVNVSENQLKANELRRHIGEDFSDNFSKTLRSRLVDVSKCGRYAFTQEIMGEYEFRFQPGVEMRKRPVAAIHTAFFGI